MKVGKLKGNAGRWEGNKKVGSEEKGEGIGKDEGKGRGEVEQVYLINCRKRESRERRREGIVQKGLSS